MISTTFPFCTVLLFIFSLSLYAAQSDVIVNDLKLFVDSQEFFIKAIAYNPVPLGAGTMSAEGVGGGGFCSNKLTMFGDWLSACYDSDYFDGSNDAPGRDPAGPTDGWFTAIWERDFPNLQALGVNTLRLYNSNPSTRPATATFTDIFPFPYGKNHTPFMDYAESFGFKVIYPLIGDASLMTSTDANSFKRFLAWQIDEVGNHPALLMYTLGNELPLDSNPTLLALVNEYIGFARSYMQMRWNRTIPITSAVVDLPTSYDYLAANLDVDVFTTNAGYRGISFVDLWSGSATGLYSGWYELSCKYNIPVFIGEIGWQVANNSIMDSIPNWFNQIWLDAINHIDQGCIGGTFFEYSDEALKPSLQQTMGVVSVEVNEVNGAKSTDPNAWIPDTVLIKEIFAYVANGTFNNIPSNMNADVFSILGRSAFTLDTLTASSSVCASFSPVACSSKSSVYDCSGNGICNYSIGACACGVGWSGSDCSVAVCAGSSTCSGHGTCDSSTSPPICNCDAGFDGDYCQNSVPASSCPIGSGATTACGDGSGICSNSTWTCSCLPGWSGLSCTIPSLDGDLLETPPPPPSTGSSSSTDSSTSSSSSSGATSSSTASASVSTSSSASSTGVHEAAPSSANVVVSSVYVLLLVIVSILLSF